MSSANNKAIVKAALKELIRDRDISRIDHYISDHYIQHSPGVKDGKAGLREMLQYLQQLPKAPDGPSPVIRAIAEDDLVMLHLDIVFMGKRMVVIDLYRLEAGKLAEHWDASREVPPGQPGGISITGGATAITDLRLTAANKAIVATFFQQPVPSLLHPKYIEHDPEIALNGGRLDSHLLQAPLTRIHRIAGEGNFVMVQSAGLQKQTPFVFYDICRLEKAKIAEHWRVGQAIPGVIAHKNGML